MEDGEIMYEAFRDATDGTAWWSFSEETYTATLDWKEKQ